MFPLSVNAQELHPLIPRIEAYSRLYGADTLLAVNIAWAESNLVSEAHSPTSTATGVYQFTKQTWLDNCTQNFDDATDPEKNIECGVRLLAKRQYFRWETSARMNGRGWLYLPVNKIFNWSPIYEPVDTQIPSHAQSGTI